MARPRSITLTEAELRLMNVLWKLGCGTVGDVAAALKGKRALAYNTVLTTMRILEAKGYLRHTKEGRAFVYEPVIGQKEAGSQAMRQLLSRFFSGSPAQLVMNLLEHESIDARELERIRKLIDGN